MATFGLHTNCDCCNHTPTPIQSSISVSEIKQKLDILVAEFKFRKRVALNLGVDPYVLLLIENRFFKLPYYESFQRGQSSPVLKTAYRFKATFICDHTGEVLKSYPGVSDKVQSLYDRIGKKSFEDLVTDLTIVSGEQAAQVIKDYRSTIEMYKLLGQELKSEEL